MTTRDDRFEATQSGGSVIIDGRTASVTLKEGAASGPMLQLEDSEGEVVILIDGVNSGVEIRGNASNLKLIDEGNTGRVLLEGTEGRLIVKGKSKAAMNMSRDEDDSLLEVGTDGIFVRDRDGKRRFILGMDGSIEVRDHEEKRRMKISIDGSISTYKNNGDPSLVIDSETGNIRTNGSITPLQIH